MTTRPPLSPVARSSPEWLNSTVDMMSAVNKRWCNENIINCYCSKEPVVHIQRENILHWTYFLVHFFTMMHKLLPAALKILLFPFCPPTPRGANTTSTIKTQQSDDVHVYICTHYTVLMASEVSLRKCERQKSHVQLFSTFQRQAFSSNPTTQQSIPVCRLALF